MTDTSRISLPIRLDSIVRQGWRTLLSVYCSNTPIWRWLKSGALVFLGFFLWMGGNVLHAYWPDVAILRYVLAYGFVVIAWGPFTHLVVVPSIIRLRRTASQPLVRRVVKHGSKINFGTFLLVVVILGTLLPGVMVLDFTTGLGTDGGDVTADLVCDTGSETVSCELENAEGVDHVVIISGGEVLDRSDEPPYAVSASRESLSEGPSGLQFEIELRDENGETLRRFIRTV
ncbi:hypothetical protein [Halopenitus sp. POP-27]|uniref:hypothetical protein n=1 Tax=Halopenitus sp. POP-27 TaxID=2994425 RepID=UPI0024682FC6|nr:hypothetical protein [Halopenitus sp. POP-27]